MTNVCDLFNSEGLSSLPELADYFYLYSVYVGRYVDLSKPILPGKYQSLPYIAEAIDKGYAKEILDFYITNSVCDVSKEDPLCVLKAMRKSVGIIHSVIRYDEGAKVEVGVDDENVDVGNH
jgi:hypothetical protein